MVLVSCVYIPHYAFGHDLLNLVFTRFITDNELCVGLLDPQQPGPVRGVETRYQDHGWTDHSDARGAVQAFD